jgi:NhaA family Na+:H+ antiporter
MRPPTPVFLRPLMRFLHTETSGGIVLLACAVFALIIANSPYGKAWYDFWHTNVTIGYGDYKLDFPLEWWVNDALMTLFFFVVGLEIKRELVKGELRDPMKAALPAAAALGGMVVPAAIYYFLQRGEPAERGWGIPMATDIAFVVGVMALLGKRVPAGLKIFLLSLAIVDDLGAVLVIAVAYTPETSMLALGLVALGLLVVLGARFAGIRAFWFYFFLGGLIWLAMVASKVHPTVAGVILGLMTPPVHMVGKKTIIPLLEHVLNRLKQKPDNDSMDEHSDEMLALVESSKETLSPLDRLEEALHPWVAFVIMPLFALANAGVALKPEFITSPVAIAVALGLFVGKPLGIVAFSWAAVKMGFARLPVGVNLPVLLGGGFLAGIGFTMSLFITALAFDPKAMGGSYDTLYMGKIGTLTGSVLSALAGVTILWFAMPKPYVAPPKSTV